MGFGIPKLKFKGKTGITQAKRGREIMVKAERRA